jgi:hypothetical protein
MWRDTIYSIVLHNLETLEIYKRLSNGKTEIINDITQYIIDAISMQPWFFEYGMRVIAFLVNLIVCISQFKKLSKCDNETRNSIIKIISTMPIINLLYKFIRNLTLLRVFDLVDMKNR